MPLGTSACLIAAWTLYSSARARLPPPLRVAASLPNWGHAERAQRVEASLPNWGHAERAQRVEASLPKPHRFWHSVSRSRRMNDFRKGATSVAPERLTLHSARGSVATERAGDHHHLCPNMMVIPQELSFRAQR